MTISLVSEESDEVAAGRAVADIHAAEYPEPPAASRIWRRASVLAWILLGAFLVDRLCLLLMDYWLFESLDLSRVFWTNFRMGAVLFLFAFLTSFPIVLPAFARRLPPRTRSIFLHLGLMWGLLSGYWFCQQYATFLLWVHGKPFGREDPFFHRDLGWYVFSYPALWSGWWVLFRGAILAWFSWMICGLVMARGEARPGMSRSAWLLGALSPRGARIALGALGALGACAWWLSRYEVLFADNSDSSIFTGASYVDVTGLFSTVNDYWFTAFVTVAVFFLACEMLGRLHRASEGHPSLPHRWPTRQLALAAGLLLAADFGFKAAVALRAMVFVKPNEPVIQLPYIREHVEATRRAFALDSIEAVPFTPKDVGDPLPNPEDLLGHPALRNVPLWPGFCSYLEEIIDIQHANRIFLTQGDTMVYGPVLEMFRQEQKLRPYYNFLDIDTIRAQVDGDTKILVSSVREVPLLEPEPWLAWWGQQFMLFTHGYGLVAAEAAGVNSEGEPVYVSAGIPTRSDIPELQATNQAVYYGEGAGSMAYTNVRQMRELDFPTDEGRAEVVYAPDVHAGVPIDSLWKRLVFGYKSGQFFEIVFSDLIGEETRVHYFRTPIERLERVAPWLYYDSDPFAVVADGRITWIVNAMTWTDRYPSSRYDLLGDKSDERAPIPQPQIRMNYVRDAAKATVDGYNGRLKIYKIADDPILESFAAIYPDLFSPGEDMPPAIRSQIQYPVQLLHTQFDDLYVLYQMKDTMTFFNMEDMWDDADEVLGPVIDQGLAVRFSIEPFYSIVRTGDGLVPAAKKRDQFCLSMVFTPESALNLRAIPIVYQDGEDYGRIVCLQVPKGHYYPGPEQAESAIDQDPDICQYFTWWTRRGSEVIRGHMTTLLVDGEILYVEPIFVRSQQNPVTQLKRVCVVFRGKAKMGATLEEALRAAIQAHVDS